MIKVILLDGPYAGRVRTFKGQLCLETHIEMDPGDLFQAFLEHNWQWSVDYSRATEEEVLLWFRVEFIARVLRALNAGRLVKFEGKIFKTKSKKPNEEEVIKTAQKVEDAVVKSGRMITIDSDDEKGLVIGVRGYEQ